MGVRKAFAQLVVVGQLLEPRFAITKNDKAVMNLTIKSTLGVIKGEGNKPKKDDEGRIMYDTRFFTIAIWGEDAQTAYDNDTFKEGATVTAIGTPKAGGYENKDGETVYQTAIEFASIIPGDAVSGGKAHDEDDEDDEDEDEDEDEAPRSKKPVSRNSNSGKTQSTGRNRPTGKR